MVWRLGGLFLALLGLLAPVSAGALEVLRLDPGACIDEVAGAPANGIATGELDSAPLVRLCDGAWRKVAVRNGRLDLTPPDTDDRQTTDRPPAVPDRLRLPDGEITTGGNRIAKAWLIAPTTIYRHGILGDRIEASGIHVRLAGGGSRELFLGADSVFEDLRVRLVDLTGDGMDEVIAIRSYLDRGAALAVLGLSAGGFVPLGESPPIGLPHRWLNPAGAADFDGDGKIELALVETPHIGGILRLFELREAGLVLEQSAPGFSNHAIGSRNLDLSAVLDWDGDGVPDLALPDAGRKAMTVVGFTRGNVVPLASQAHEPEIATAVRATDLDGDGRAELLYGLSDGSLVLLKP